MEAICSYDGGWAARLEERVAEMIEQGAKGMGFNRLSFQLKKDERWGCRGFIPGASELSTIHICCYVSGLPFP